MKRRREIVIFSGIVLIALLAVMGKALTREKGNTLYIAAAGPFDMGNRQGEKMRQGIDLAVAEVNRGGGIHGKSVEVLYMSDENRAGTAGVVSGRIADESQAHVVLGHFLSSASIAAGDRYRGKIPAITGSATADEVTRGNDWYFSVVFNNTYQAQFVANYIRNVLKHVSVYIIYDGDAFGRSLAEVMEEKFQGLGGAVRGKWEYSAGDGAGRDDIEGIVAKLQAANRPEETGAVFLALHREQAARAIGLIRRKGLALPVIGPDSLGDQALIKTLAEMFPEERTNPGHFSNGIYAASHIIFDIAGEKAQHFMEKFAEKYEGHPAGGNPTWESAVYYDAARLALEAMRVTRATGDPGRLAEERGKIRDHLAGMTNPVNAMKGVCGDIYFQNDGNANQQVMIGKFENQKFISAMTQLFPMFGINSTTNLGERLANDRVVIVDGKYMNKTQVVYAGIDVLDITDFEILNASYSLDFYLWFRHRVEPGPAGVETLKVENIEFTNAVEKIDLGKPIYEEVNDGVCWKAYRVKAKFKGDFRFDHYPFDRQKITLRFHHMNLTRGDLIYVVDVQGMRKTGGPCPMTQAGPGQVPGGLNDWTIDHVVFYQDTEKNVSTLGNPDAFNTDIGMLYSRFNMDIEIIRDSVCFTLKNLFPLCIILILTYLAFYLSLEEFSKSNGLAGGALLTAAFFHMQLCKNLPAIDYIVALDYIFYVAYSLILFQVILTTSSNRAYVKNNMKMVLTLSRIGKAVVPLVALTGILFLGLRYQIYPAKTQEAIAHSAMPKQRSYKIGFVTAPGGLNDNFYNDMVYRGLASGEKELGIRMKIAVPPSCDSGTIHGMIESLIYERCQMIIVVGSHAASAVNSLASRFSPVTFVLVGGRGETRPNIVSITYRQHEGAFLSGVLSAMVPGASTLGFLGGTNSAHVKAAGLAFERGARLINPDIAVIREYIDTTGDFSGFNDAHSAYRIAREMYGQGTAVIFGVCGGSGQGIRQAAGELNRLTIGVDTGPGGGATGCLLTTMPPCIEKGIFDIIGKAVNSEAPCGHVEYGLKDNAIHLADSKWTRYIGSDTKIREADRIRDDIISGKIRVTQSL